MTDKNRPALASNLVKRQFRANGPMEAAKINDFFDELFSDNVQIVDFVNREQLDIKRFKETIVTEILTVRERLAELEAKQEIDNEFAADNSTSLVFSADFRDVSKFTTTQFTEANRLRVDSTYGMATVPYNEYRSRFHIVDPRTSNVFTPDTLVATVTSIDENNGVLTEGTPKNAFNGQNESFWQRTVTYPLSSDRDMVTCQLDVDVPLQFAQQANVLTVNPFPQGNVDITSILFSTDASVPTTTLPGFPAAGIKNAKATKFYFAPLAITKLRITFRQRRWHERDELKTFVYGAQEIDLALVEFDKTNDPSILNNNALVIKVDSPSGFTFNKITNFFSDDEIETGSSATGVFFQIYSDASLTTKLWDSFTDPTPTATPIDVAPSAVSSIYVLIVLKYKELEQVTPVLERMGFEYTVTV